jgi:signal transduction histidine kinase
MTEVKPLSLFDRLERALRLSMTARLWVIAAISVIGLMIVGWIAYDQFNRRLMQLLIDPDIGSVSSTLIAGAQPGPDGGIVLTDTPDDPRYREPGRGRYFQVSRIRDDGTLETVAASLSLFDVTLSFSSDQIAHITAPDGDPGARFIDIPKGPDGESVRVAATVAQFRNVEGRFLFAVGAAPRQIVGPAADLGAMAFAAFVIFCGLGIPAITIMQIRIGLEPLRRLRRDIMRVRRGDTGRLEGEYAAELQSVSREVNALLDHNQEVVERARRHVGNLAHALKTPIAVLKNAASQDHLEPEIVRPAIAEMETFVERQLRRARVAARAEARAGMSAATVGYRTPVLSNLNDLIFMMEQKYDHQKAVDIELVAEADVTFRGEREDLLEMVANLVDNACKYGKSRVQILLLPPLERNGLMEIIVEDDGPGLSDAQLEKVKTRGVRLDEAAPGQGLGLSILREAVELYSGELKFERSALGGLKARLKLPATD